MKNRAKCFLATLLSSSRPITWNIEESGEMDIKLNWEVTLCFGRIYFIPAEKKKMVIDISFLLPKYFYSSNPQCSKTVSDSRLISSTTHTLSYIRTINFCFKNVDLLWGVMTLLEEMLIVLVQHVLELSTESKCHPCVWHIHVSKVRGPWP